MTDVQGDGRTADVREPLRAYWNRDAATYDRAPSHMPRFATEYAAWAAALLRLLPKPPARVLDVGAGTGFLSLLLARLGYRVTALDSAPAMLERVRGKAADAALEVDVVEADAAEPPDGPFDAVVQRHLLWTLPDPRRALDAWRRAAPDGRLVVFESLWGPASDPAERLRGRARGLVHRLLDRPGDHHAEYDPQWRNALPLGTGTSPESVAALVAESAWGQGRLYRLRDVEWATLTTLPPWERVFGVTPRFALVAGDPAPGG
ncbi:MAG: methyltransferase domain-containing protein [Streptosporangiales bacterium]|nr:methyltransferase domain-containing protein [Streptosporangiales bacterium]